MDPTRLIKQDLGLDEFAAANEAWTDPIVQIDSPSPFTSFKLYRVRGRTGQFDFPMLPYCSYGIYAANGREAIRLTRKGREIQHALREDWSDLDAADPAELATAILWFYDAGINASHRVLQDMADLRQFSADGRPECGYVLNEKVLANIEDDVGDTRIEANAEQITLRALTLMGWRHQKRNLGVELIHIARDGSVHLDKRRVLSRRIFKRIPTIMY